MQNTLTQAAAEQAIHDALEAGDADMLEAFADFAAGEIDDKHVAALLLVFLQADEVVYKTRLSAALHRLVDEQERLRAHFIERRAFGVMRDEEASQLAATDLDRESNNANR
jgi:hypothetical protein